MYTVVGLKEIVSKKSGDKYYEIHCTYDDNKVKGLACDRIFCSSSSISCVDLLCVGSLIRVSYDKFGRVEYVEVIE